MNPALENSFFLVKNLQLLWLFFFFQKTTFHTEFQLYYKVVHKEPNGKIIWKVAYKIKIYVCISQNVFLPNLPHLLGIIPGQIAIFRKMFSCFLANELQIFYWLLSSLLTFLLQCIMYLFPQQTYQECLCQRIAKIYLKSCFSETGSKGSNHSF